MGVVVQIDTPAMLRLHIAPVGRCSANDEAIFVFDYRLNQPLGISLLFYWRGASKSDKQQ
jgi:hypothetical protein